MTIHVKLKLNTPSRMLSHTMRLIRVLQMYTTDVFRDTVRLTPGWYVQPVKVVRESGAPVGS